MRFKINGVLVVLVGSRLREGRWWKIKIPGKCKKKECDWKTGGKKQTKALACETSDKALRVRTPTHSSKHGRDRVDREQRQTAAGAAERGERGGREGGRETNKGVNTAVLSLSSSLISYYNFIKGSRPALIHIWRTMNREGMHVFLVAAPNLWKVNLLDCCCLCEVHGQLLNWGCRSQQRGITKTASEPPRNTPVVHTGFLPSNKALPILFIFGD